VPVSLFEHLTHGADDGILAQQSIAIRNGAGDRHRRGRRHRGRYETWERYLAMGSSPGGFAQGRMTR